LIKTICMNFVSFDGLEAEFPYITANGAFVNFPILLEKLKAVGYDGPFTLEREIADKEQRIKDNKEAIKFIADIWNEL